MQLPLFYIPDYKNEAELILDEVNSRHVIQVLRKGVGDLIQLTDGKGSIFTAEISADHKKHCTVAIREVKQISKPVRNISIAISLLKNANRFEWFLEKATELGVSNIIPILSHRTEKERFRHDRMHQILISALLQSQQAWLPVLHQPITLELLFLQEEVVASPQKFIAHCEEQERTALIRAYDPTKKDALILIGPEGDFTSTEITLALKNNFSPVTLGDTRLRSETAGVVAATLLCLV